MAHNAFHNKTGGRFGTRSPRKEREGGVNPFDIAQIGFDTLFPAIDLAFNKRQERRLRRDARVDLERVDLNAGPVRGLRRPRFALPSRAPTGSTLGSQISEKLFRDARLSDQEFQFNAQDEAFRLQQEQQARGIENREALANVGIANQEELANANVAAQELLGLSIPNREASKTALFQNVSGDISEIGTGISNKNTTLAMDILTRQEDGGYTLEDVEWARRILTPRGVGGRKGRLSNL